MSCDAFLDQIELEGPTIVVDSSEGLTHSTRRKGESLPKLMILPERRIHRVNLAVLQNEFLEVAFALDLGGRLWSVTDRKTGNRFLAAPGELQIVPSEVRGAELAHGILPYVGDTSGRLNSLAPVEWHLTEPQDSDDPAEILFFDLVPELPISWYAKWSLPAGQPVLNLSVKINNYYDSIEPIREISFVLQGTERTKFVQVGAEPVIALGRDDRVLRISDPAVFDQFSSSRAERRLGMGEFFSRSVDSFSIDFTPCYIPEDSTMELPEALDHVSVTTLEQVSRKGSAKVAARLQMLYSRVRAGEFRAALDEVDDTLQYAGDDPRIWWLKSALERHVDLEGSDGASVLNAHYLSPMEPLMRCESYLRMPMTEHSGPNPIFEPFTHDPDLFSYTLCAYIEAGLAVDASRLADEYLRHRDIAMIRYLYSYLLLVLSRQKSEAAIHAMLAEGLEVSPPFPWRHLERTAVSVLANEFPKLSELGNRTERWGRSST